MIKNIIPSDQIIKCESFEPKGNASYCIIYVDEKNIYAKTKTEEDAIKIVSLYNLTNIGALYYKEKQGRCNKTIKYKDHKKEILNQFFERIQKIEDRYRLADDPEELNETDKLDYYMIKFFGDDIERQNLEKDID